MKVTVAQHADVPDMLEMLCEYQESFESITHIDEEKSEQYLQQLIGDGQTATVFIGRTTSGKQAVAFANDVYDRRSEEIARLEPQRRVTPDQIEERDLVEDLAVNATVELGGLHLERDDAEATVRLLTPIVVVYDDVIGKRHVCAEAYFLLGRARAAQNDLAAARENYEKARDRLAPASDEDADLRQQVDDALDQLPPDTP